MNLTRRELKFQIPLALVDPLSDYIEKFCEMDKYSVLAPDQYYVINSLYLDNDHMLLLENKRANMPRRYSMRIRSYGMQASFPAFMEIKGKVDLLVNKRRCIITRPETISLLRDGHGFEGNPDMRHPYMNEACFNILRLGLKPKIMTQYKRKAYFGLHEAYSRVTFDRHMRCYAETDYNIFPDSDKFVNYDHQQQYMDGLENNVVLELKCDLKVPAWMMEMIKIFQLKQAQFSKYDSSWSHLNDDVDPNFGSMLTTNS